MVRWSSFSIVVVFDFSNVSCLLPLSFNRWLLVGLVFVLGCGAFVGSERLVSFYTFHGLCWHILAVVDGTSQSDLDEL